MNETNLIPSPPSPLNLSAFRPTISNLLASLNDTMNSDDDEVMMAGNTTLAGDLQQVANSTQSWHVDVWALQKRRLCEYLDVWQATLRDADSMVVALFAIAIGIALAGIVAIVCQLRCRSRGTRKERELRYDTERWLDYSFSREKLTPSELSQLRKATHWQNCVSPLSYKTEKAIAVAAVLPPVNAQPPATIPVEMLYEKAVGHSAVDVNRNVKEAKTKNMKKPKSVPTKRLSKKGKCLTKCLTSNSSYDLKEVSKPNRKAKSGSKKAKKSLVGLTAMHYDKSEMSVPLYYGSISSSQSQALLGVGSLTRKEYETQTLAIDLTGSDDDDVEMAAARTVEENKSNEAKIFEKLTNAPNRSVGNVVYAKKSSNESSAAGLRSQPNISTAVASGQRIRQQVPAGVVAPRVRSNCEFGVVRGKYRGESSDYSATPTSFSEHSSGRFSKNPLYNELSDIEELIMFDSLKKSAGALSGSFKQNYSRKAGDGLEEKPVIYSTFIKPKQPRH